MKASETLRILTDPDAPLAPTLAALRRRELLGRRRGEQSLVHGQRPGRQRAGDGAADFTAGTNAGRAGSIAIERIGPTPTTCWF